jgi:hypothetical protein
VPRFRLHLEWDDDYGSRDKAKEGLADIAEEILGLSVVEGEPTATLEVFDVVAHPAKGGGDVREPQQVELIDVLGQRSTVVHPWDQGLWILPEDHPLHDMERRARDQDDQVVKKELTEAARALMQRNAPLDNDPTP